LLKYAESGLSSRNKYLSLAAILDPRKKIFFYPVQSLVTSDERRKYKEMFLHHYDKHYRAFERRETNVRAENHTVQSLAMKIASHSTPDPSTNRRDAEKYLAQECIDMPPLEYWKAQETVMPGLARMAKDILGASLSSVCVERAFSKAGDVMSNHRTRLSVRMFRHIMTIKCSPRFRGDLTHIGTRKKPSFKQAHSRSLDEVLRDMEGPSDDEDIPNILASPSPAIEPSLDIFHEPTVEETEFIELEDVDELADNTQNSPLVTPTRYGRFRPG
jgi:hypothetical protein